MTVAPPERAVRLMKWSLAPWERAAILGDLQEEFAVLGERDGARAAERWYWRQTVRSIWPNVVRRYRGDEHRLAMARQGLTSLGMAGVWGVMATVGSAMGRPDNQFLWIMTATSALGGVATQARSLFQKRMQPADIRKAHATAVAYLVVMAVLFTAAYFTPFRQTFERAPWTVMFGVVLPISLLLPLVLRLWPWWPSDRVPVERVVEGRRDLHEIAETDLSIVVPNHPLGLSSVMLGRTSGVREGPGFPPFNPTIARVFQPHETIHVSVVVNGGDARTATLSLVDGSGDTVRSADVSVVTDGLQEKVRSWDDVVDGDPATDFGEVRGAIDLGGVSDGRYLIRVTVGDGEHTSEVRELIVVASDGRRP